MPNLKSSGRLKADVVSYVVTATPPLSSHSLIAACFVVPWTLMTLRRLNLSISLHQLIMTLAGNQLLHGVVVLDRLLLKIIPCIAF